MNVVVLGVKIKIGFDWGEYNDAANIKPRIYK
jgi:hypothetical protein